MSFAPTNKYPARYFWLQDSRYMEAWKEDDEHRKLMIKATKKFAEKVGAVNFKFMRTPQGGYAPGIFIFHKMPNFQMWKPAGPAMEYVLREDTPQGQRLWNLMVELPNLSFLKVLSVAGIDDIANMALPPNQVLLLQGQLYLVWYAPAEIPVPFGGAQELKKLEFDRIYVDSLGRDARA